MAIIFRELTKHAGRQFLPKVPLGFEDPDVEPYMIHAGWAEATTEEPVHIYPKEEISVDLDTRHTEAGVTVGEIIKHDGNVDAARAARLAASKEADEAALAVANAGAASGATEPGKEG